MPPMDIPTLLSLHPAPWHQTHERSMAPLPAALWDSQGQIIGTFRNADIADVIMAWMKTAHTELTAPVAAIAHSADGTHTAIFNARPHLEQATRRQIDALTDMGGTWIQLVTAQDPSGKASPETITR